MKAGGKGGGQETHESMDLERDAGLGEMSPESGTGPVVPGSHCIQEGQVVLRVAWPGLGIQRAAEQGRDHSPLCTGVHASAVSGPTLPAQSARPGSPSEGRGSVSPRIRAAGAERPPYWCASAGCAGQPLGSSASSSAVSETPQGPGTEEIYKTPCSLTGQWGGCLELMEIPLGREDCS